ncbi:MAG: UDP-3-O-(3-hydroxymyristoyl)glucosamine N-acyltransferase [Rhabdochlamydiaceae bacterium]
MQQPQSFTLSQLAHLTQSQFSGDPEFQVNGVDSLETASLSDVSFLENLKYKESLHSTKAGIVCVHPDIDRLPGKNYLISSNPSWCFQKIVDLILGKTYLPSSFQGIHPTAIVSEGAYIEENVSIGPYTVIDRGVKVQAGTYIGPHCFIGPDCEIGRECLIHPNVTIREKTILGNNVILQPGVVLGSCGFGYHTNQKGEHIKIPQLGNVVVEDFVEIGSHSVVDRARFKSTIIKKGSKIDNLVQIGHNVHIGEHNIIVSQTGIAGSSKTGQYVILGGQVGVVGHIEITDHVTVASRGGVSKSIKESGVYGGAPHMPLKEYHKQEAQLRQIGNLIRKIELMEKQIQEMENVLKSS